MMKRTTKLQLGVLCYSLANAVLAATALKFAPAINVSQTATPTEKAKVVRLAFLDGALFKKAWLFTYGDGPVGQQNVYARYSFDEGATWSAPILLSRDGANAPTGGQSIVARNSLAFLADNDKPSVFAAPITAGPRVVVTWNSGYCPQGPGEGKHAGSYINPVQGAGDSDGDGTIDRPFHCVWVATTTDPALGAWDVQQLTTGQRDAIGEVVAGNSTGDAFALAWQEDPAGLQPGEAEGRGDGGMGAHATGGTNIWYAHAAAPNGATLRANVAQLSNNNALGTGQPGASRPNLQLSGSTASVAYEETACPGGSSGKCIVYHSFAYSNHDANSAGTVISDVTKNARRVRFILQGANAAGGSKLRTVVLWRESPAGLSAAPADIVVRRGLVDAVARPGSNGYRASDILADSPQNMTNVAASGGNANAHRAIVRGSVIVLAYDQTPDMDAADPDKTANPTTNYNLFVMRSTQDGRQGSWSAAMNLSRIDSPAMTVVEPRTVPTPGTIVNPLTGTPDVGDAQDTNVFYVAYATETNTLDARSGRVYVSRSTDQGASYEPFVPVSPAPAGQSESQLRPLPDGSSSIVMWMAEQTIGNPDTKDATMAVATAVQLPDLRLTATGASFPVGSQRSLTLSLLNQGMGDAAAVTVTGSLPDGLTPVGISDPPNCAIIGQAFSCSIAEIPANRGRTVSMTVSSAVEGFYSVPASASSDGLDADASDNAVEVAVNVTAPVAPPEPEPEPAPQPHDGGGCSTAGAGGPLDPVLPMLAGLGLLGLALRRVAR